MCVFACVSMSFFVFLYVYICVRVCEFVNAQNEFCLLKWTLNFDQKYSSVATENKTKHE